MLDEFIINDLCGKCWQGICFAKTLLLLACIDQQPFVSLCIVPN